MPGKTPDCPTCGAVLPSLTGEFCPECGMPIEPPEIPDENSEDEASEDEKEWE